MWVPAAVVDWFQISKEAVDALREELAATRVERDILKHQLTVTQTQFDWLRLRVNALEHERAQLVKTVYNINSPVPEIVRTPSDVEQAMNSFSFEDVGEDLAKRLGLPVYNS